jgi:tetratricopeptide (TPR) repeat protein
MPSHIFVRIGDWDRVVDWNRRSAAAALEHPVGDTVSNHYFHALDYLAYGYLQEGRDAEAREVAATLRAVRGPMHLQPAVPYALAAVPARLALERQDWKAAAALQPRVPAEYPWDNYPAMEALTHFAIALGAARSGDLPRAQRAVARLAELRERAAASSPYWAKQVEIQRLAAEAWVEFAAGRKEEGLTAMRQAAELEAGTDKHPVTPGELLPASELLGDMLLEMRRPKEALAAYQAALQRSPGRRNALRGVERSGGRAVGQSGGG